MMSKILISNFMNRTFKDLLHGWSSTLSSNMTRTHIYVLYHIIIHSYGGENVKTKICSLLQAKLQFIEL